ncbi:MAG: hypothetical protein E7262_01495 [Lachnospiraceae bacterium]|nr:hypothetical protein [Lachnospiraceae bacterium]
MRKINKGTLVKVISMGLAVAILAGVALNPISGKKAKASEESENVEVVFDEYADVDLNWDEDYINIDRFGMTPEMEANIDNLENMTEEEFAAVFYTDEYDQNFVAHYEQNKRGVDDIVLKALKKIIKEKGKKGIKELIEKVAKKLPGFVTKAIAKLLGKEWKERIVGVLVMVSSIEDGLVDFIADKTGINKKTVQVIVEVISWII